MKPYMPGDPIAYNTNKNYYAACFIHFDNVDKIYKNGLLTMEGRRFNLRGQEVKTEKHPYPSSYIVDVEEARQMIFDDTRRKADRKIVQEAAELLGQASKRLTDRTREALLNLIDILKKED